MPEPRRRWAIVGDVLILAALVAVGVLAWRAYQRQSADLFWVFAGLGLVCLVGFVLVLIAALRSGRPSESAATAAAEPAEAVPDGPAALAATDRSAPAALAAGVAQPAVDHTPMVAADQAIGYGWAKASDLARGLPSDPA